VANWALRPLALGAFAVSWVAKTPFYRHRSFSSWISIH
jgi:hypothetical protein